MLSHLSYLQPKTHGCTHTFHDTDKQHEDTPKHYKDTDTDTQTQKSHLSTSDTSPEEFTEESKSSFFPCGELSGVVFGESPVEDLCGSRKGSGTVKG
jgi:hypothetical protein